MKSQEVFGTIGGIYGDNMWEGWKEENLPKPEDKKPASQPTVPQVTQRAATVRSAATVDDSTEVTQPIRTITPTNVTEPEPEPGDDENYDDITVDSPYSTGENQERAVLEERASKCLDTIFNTPHYEGTREYGGQQKDWGTLLQDTFTEVKEGNFGSKEELDNAIMDAMDRFLKKRFKGRNAKEITKAEYQDIAVRWVIATKKGGDRLENVTELVELLKDNVKNFV